MKVKKTYYQLLMANLLMGEYLKKQPLENKICAAIKIFSKELKRIAEDYNDQLDSLQIANCAIDPITKIILKDEKGNRQFTVEGELNLKKQGKDLLFSEVEVNNKIFDDINELIIGLTEDEKNSFSGLVIPEQIN